MSAQFPYKTAASSSVKFTYEGKGYAGAPLFPQTSSTERPGEYRDVAREVTTPDDDQRFVFTRNDV